MSDPTDAAWRAPLAVALGAVPGALARYYVNLACVRLFGPGLLPVGTLAANLSGALLMGVLVTLALERLSLSPDLRLLLAVGFLGSYTTFSSYALEMSNLWRSREFGVALFYGLGSPLLGFLGVELGRALARR